MSTRMFFLVTNCLFITSFSLVAYSQTIQALAPYKSDKLVLTCVYQCQYQLDSLSTKQLSERMRLQIGKSISVFESLNAHLRDFLIAEVKNSVDQRGPIEFNASGLPTARYLTNFRQLIYKVSAPKTTIVYDRIGSTKYYYLEPNAAFNWQISSETQEIAGYHCQLAVTRYAGRTWQAWFTKEIPLSDGPYKFYGLPGLILKLQDSRKYYSFETSEISKPKGSEAIFIQLPEFAAAKIDKAAFIAEKAQYERTLTDRLIGEGAFPNQTPQELEELRQKAKARLASQNNPIELR